ncbi:MAG: CBS domain-containing protein [Thiohalomonadales bacterium]|nr:CBS domain-containing protein [Thiohalomonadales bacterium]
MSAGEYCNRDVVIVSKNEPVSEAISLMRSHHVGDVVVVETIEQTTVPVGILTDRDIVLEILAEAVDLDAVTIGDVMSYAVVTVTEKTTLIDTIKLMRDKGVRRIPVVNEKGGLEGLLSVDDILELLAEQLTNIVSLIGKEQARESSSRR